MLLSCSSLHAEYVLITELIGCSKACFFYSAVVTPSCLPSRLDTYYMKKACAIQRESMMRAKTCVRQADCTVHVKHV